VQANLWQWVYEYTVGGVFFFITLWLCFRLGGAEADHPADRRTRLILILGLIGYFCGHGLWIYLASR
jgi:hypothetical protein